MSDAVKPQMHGRDHRPGGADPIPGTDNSWCRIWGVSASTTALSGVNKQLVFLNEVNDAGADYYAINSSREIEVQKDGLYSIQGQANWGSYIDQREIYCVYNNTTGLQGIGVTLSPWNDYTVVNDTQRLVAGDAVTLWVHQDSGGAHTFGGDECHLEVRYLGFASTANRFDV